MSSQITANTNLTNIISDLWFGLERRCVVRNFGSGERRLEFGVHRSRWHHEPTQQFGRTPDVAGGIGLEVLINDCQSIVVALLVGHFRFWSHTIEHDVNLETALNQQFHPNTQTNNRKSLKNTHE